MIGFKSIPFLRILFPYVLGILFVLQFGIMANFHLVFITSGICFFITFLFQKYYKPIFAFKKIIYTISVNVFLFLLAFETNYFYNAKNDDKHYSNYVTANDQQFFCTVNDLPVITEKFVKLPVTLTLIQVDGNWKQTNGSSFIYLKKPVTQSFLTGNTLLVSSKFSNVNPPQNPNEFNYKRFLQYKNIYNIIYASSTQVFKINSFTKGFSFTQLGTLIKAHVVDVFRNSGLSQEAFSICSALLVGYDDEISGDVMSSFSHSGTLHVLSVSGMHTGVLYIALVFLFGVFDKHNRYKKTRCFSIIAVLVLFVLITGFSPSVLRAALMLALVIVGKTFYRNGNSYNTLCLSAFLLLLYNPLLIMDVGFMLSYLAVFGIMYLYPILNNIYFVKNNILRWCWNLTLMSVAATVFTLPVSLYFFHQFPLWFMFSNLIIIPISTGLMAVSFLLLLFYKVFIVKQILVWLINAMVSIMLWVAHLTDSKAFGFIDFISFTKTDTILCSLLIILILWAYTSKGYKAVIALFLVCIVWTSVSVFANYTEIKEKELIVFYVKQKPAYVLRIGHTVYTHTDSLTEKEFQRFVKPYLLNYSSLTLINDTSNLFKMQETSVLNLQNKSGYIYNQNVNYVIVSNNSSVSLKSVQQIKPLVIADCSNSYNFVKQLKEQCAELRIPFYSIKEEGALTIHF